MTGAISFILLSLVGLSCAYLLFTRNFIANIWETIGFSLIGIWSLARLPVKAITGETELVHMMLHIGLAAYFIGKLWRVTNNQGKYNGILK